MSIELYSQFDQEENEWAVSERICADGWATQEAVHDVWIPTDLTIRNGGPT